MIVFIRNDKNRQSIGAETRSVFALGFRVGAGSGEKGRSERGMRGT